jgi:histidinol-phosphate aminotransferase
MGLTSGEPPEFWITDHPDRVESLHQQFVDAGSDIILTNTFGCNRHRLKLHNAQDRTFELAKAAASVGGLLVVDEAYAEFSSETSAATLIAQYPNVIVIRTMSKAFAFAGARLGYLIADPAVIDALQLVRLPYHLSAITQAVAEVALSFSAELLAGVDTLIAQREIVQAELTKLGLTITPSAANFLLFGGFKQPTDQIWQKLLDRGILIRDVGLLGQLRVTIGTAAENQAFISALTEVLAEGDK